MHTTIDPAGGKGATLAFEAAATACLAASCLKEAFHWEGVTHLELTAYAFSAAFVIHDLSSKWLILWRQAAVRRWMDRPAKGARRPHPAAAARVRLA